MDEHACRICGNLEGNRTHLAREMMFGYRDRFEYLECGGCGCLQITSPPADLSRYYGPDYYAYHPEPAVVDPAPIAYLKRRRAEYCLGERSALGWVALRLFGTPPYYTWLRMAGASHPDAILDVGAGNGGLLLALRREGFSNLTGLEPYGKEDVTHRNGVRILARHLVDLDGSFDLIMFHHSFEHVGDPLAELRHVHRLLRRGGRALLRIPVASCRAWKEYGVDWVQLDAPRHLFLHTPESLRLLAEGAGLDIAAVEYDSDAFQFWGSELYRRDIPLVHRDQHPFPELQMEAWRQRAAELNRSAQGDQARFLLRKP